jgi:hypothetical protein
MHNTLWIRSCNDLVVVLSGSGLSCDLSCVLSCVLPVRLTCLGPSWPQARGSWVHLGFKLGVLGPSRLKLGGMGPKLAGLGAILAPILEVLGASCLQVGGCWLQVGRCWSYLSSKSGGLGSKLGVWGRLISIFAANFAPSWHGLGHILARRCWVLGHLGRYVKSIEKQTSFIVFFHPMFLGRWRRGS